MNPRLFDENILLIFSGSIWARDKSNTNFRILISRAFRWTSQIFTPINATADIRQSMIFSHLFDKKFNFVIILMTADENQIHKNIAKTSSLIWRGCVMIFELETCLYVSSIPKP